MINLHQLRIFYVTAEHMSFTAAAERLYMTQPAVSMQVKALEKQLGVKLFERVSNQLALTEIGRALFQSAAAVLHAEDVALQVLEEMKGTSKGRLTLGTNTTGGMYVLPPILRAFKENHPAFHIVLQIDATDRIADRIAQNIVDIGFVGGPLQDGRFSTETIFQDELVPIVSPSHPLAHASGSLEDLAQQPFIVPEMGSRTRRIIERTFKEAGYDIQVAMQMPGTEAVKKAVEANLGVAVVSRYAVLREARLGALCIPQVEGFPLWRPLEMVYRKQRYFSPAATEFRNFVRRYAEKDLAGSLG